MVFVWLQGVRRSSAIHLSSLHLFVPTGPPYLPAAAAPTHPSLTSIWLLPLLLWVSPFSFCLYCFCDLHTVHLTEFEPSWVSDVRMEGEVVQAKHKMAGYRSEQQILLEHRLLRGSKVLH